MRDEDKTKEQLIAENEELRRRGAEGALQECEGRYRALAESTRDVIYILDRHGTLLYANQAAAQCIGIPSGEIVGKRQADLFPPEMAQAHLEKVAQVFATGDVFEEDELFHFGPEEVWLRIHLLPLRDDAGQITSVMGVCHDITGRKRAEEAGRFSEAKYRRFYESMMDAFASADMDGSIREYNEAYRAMLGYEPEELLALRYMDVTPEKWHSLQAEIIQKQVLSRGYSDIYEKEYRRKDGTIFPVELRTFLLKDDRGRPCAMWGIVRDITERKRAQEALKKSHDELKRRVEQRTAELREANERLQREVDERRRAEEALRASEERLRLAQQVGRVGTFELDLQTGLNTWTPELEAMYGLSPGGFPKTESAWENLVYCDDRAGAIRLREHTLKTGKPVEGEWRVVWPDGSVHWLTGRWQAFKDESGKQLRLTGVNIDITERKRAEEALERERQSLWRMLQASDHERQTISYEIHDGLAQYLAAAGMQFQVFDGLRESNPEEAKKAYDAATQLVSQSHAEARRLISEVRPPVIDKIGLETAISHLVHEQRRRGRPKIRFHSDVQFGRLPPILENAIYRIVQEALTNACKHSKSKEVTVAMTQEGEDVRLEVRDWGIGFDPESIEKGHFGLEGVRQRARLLGGRLTIESAPGSGTLVQVVVPILEKQNED